MIDAAELRRKLDAETRALAAIKDLVDAMEQHIHRRQQRAPYFDGETGSRAEAD